MEDLITNKQKIVWYIKKLLGQPVMITVGVLIALPISPIILYLIYKWTT